MTEQASPRGSEQRGAGPVVGPSAQSNLPRAMRYFLALDSNAGKSSWEAAKLSILFFTEPSTYKAQLHDISGGSKLTQSFLVPLGLFPAHPGSLQLQTWPTMEPGRTHACMHRTPAAGT